MAEYEVTCVSRTSDDHESITHLGGAFGTWGKATVVAKMMAGHTFYTVVGGTRANVGLNGPPATRHLQTYPGNSWVDDLLKLPCCP